MSLDVCVYRVLHEVGEGSTEAEAQEAEQAGKQLDHVSCKVAHQI